MNLGFDLGGAGTLINIQSIDDPFARYKMPRLESRTKSKGQYGETFLHNLKEIAEALKVREKWLARFLGTDLSSQIKKGESQWILKGEFQYDALEASLRKFISRYVLCPKCDLPELDYQSIGKGKRTRLGIKCRGCGWNEVCDPSKDRIHKMILQP